MESLAAFVNETEELAKMDVEDIRGTGRIKDGSVEVTGNGLNNEELVANMDVEDNGRIEAGASGETRIGLNVKKTNDG